MYVLEFFKNGNWYYRHDVESLSVTYDYLYQSKVSVPITVSADVYEEEPDFNLNGTYCAVVDDKNNQIFVGYVSEWSESDILLESILRRLEFDIMPRVVDSPSIEQEMVSVCQAQYTNNSDHLQNLPYITFSAATTTVGKVNVPKIAKLSEALYYAIKRYQIVVIPRLDLNGGQIFIEFKKISTSELSIKTDVIQEINIITELTSATNKVEYYNNGGNLLATYYLLLNNTVSTNANDVLRISPVNPIKKVVDETQSGFNLDDLAKQDLQGNIYHQEIEFSLSLDDELIDLNAIEVGTKIKIYSDYRVYSTIVTGLTFDTTTRKLTVKCGMVRSDLSNLIWKKLKRGGYYGTSI